MRRLAIVLIGGASLVLLAAPASATCASGPFDQAVRKADVVWWGTVTDSGVTGAAAPGQWGLTVQVKDGLKGPMPESPNGSIGTVFVSSCGPILSAQRAQTVATQFLGTTRLFVGQYANGVLVSSSELYVEHLTPEQQYQRALKDLGLTRSTRPSSVEVTGSERWLWTVATIVAVVAVGVGLMTYRRRRSSTAV